MTGALLIVGAGGLGREVLEATRAAGATGLWRVVGFLDDAPPAERVDGVPVLGGLDDVGRYPDAHVVVCVGSATRNHMRRTVVERLALPPERYANVVHPSAVIPAATRLGNGTIVLAGVIATTPVSVGSHVTVMPGTILTHDDEVASFATFASGVRLSGGVRVGEGAYLGAGAVVREHLAIGAWATVGAGALVLEDVPPGEVWVGAPARRLRAAP